MAEPLEPVIGATCGSTSLAEVVKRLCALEDRITSLEAKLRDEREVASKEERKVVAHPPRNELRGFDFETVFGLTWLNRAGAVLLILGLGLATFWAHDRGYLTPVIREVVGGLVAAALFALGTCAAASSEPGRRSFGTGVTVVGAFGLYLIAIASARVDAIISVQVATGLALLFTMALAVLASMLDRRLFALLGLVGGLLLPLFANSGPPEHGILFAYLAVLSAVFVGLQLRARWALLDLIASFGVCAYYVAWIGTSPTDGWLAPTVGALIWAAHLALAGLRPALIGARSQPDPFPLVLLMAVAIGGFGVLFAGSLPPHLRGAIALGLFGYQAYLWRDPTRRRFPFAMIALALLASVWLLLSPDAGPTSELAPVLSTAACGLFVLLYLLRAATGPGLSEEDHALAAAANLALVIFWLIAGAHWGQLAVAALPSAALGAAWLGVGAWLRRGDRATGAAEWSDIFGALLCTAAAVLAFETISASWHALSLASTVAIILCGLALVRVGVRSSLGASRLTGLAVLTLALIKLLALDIWVLSNGPRIAVLVAIGAGLLGASFLYGGFADTHSRRADDCLLSREELERRREKLLDALGQVPNDAGLLARLDDHGGA